MLKKGVENVKYIKLCLFYILTIMVLSRVTIAKEMITNITILGLERTNQSIVLDVLPFQEGDLCKDSELDNYVELIYKRLVDLEIFDRKDVNILTTVFNDNILQLVINIKEPNLINSEPIPYVFSKIQEVFLGELNQIFYNPFGNGMNILAGYWWNADYYDKYYYIGFSSPFYKGWNWIFRYENFDRHHLFSDLEEYSAKGWQGSFKMKNYLTENLKINYGLNFYTAQFSTNQILTDQKYLILTITTEITKNGQININGSYMHSLGATPSTWKLWADYQDVKSFSATNKLVYSIKAGIAGSETPLNFNFYGGGFSDLPLRGHSKDLKGDKYTITNLEIYQSLIDDLWAICFVDLGSFWSNEDFVQIDFKKSLGFGIVYDQSEEMVIRFDIVPPIFENDFVWKINFGNSY